jgi:phosphoglycolate phosphatase
VTPEPGPIRAVAFDLDGTLLDTLPDIAAAADAMLVAQGRAPVGAAVVRGFIGEGIATLVKRLLTGEIDGEPDPAVLEPALAQFFEGYFAHLSVHTRPFAGMSALVERLAERSVPLACVTNKAERFTRPLLAAHGLLDRFDVVVGGDTLGVRKPHPRVLQHTAAALGVAPEALLMVGDSVTDVRAARAAGTPVVVVPWGYTGGEPAEALGADAVLVSAEELQTWIAARLLASDRISSSLVR